ncbi:hypothetical protein H8N00_16070, partial [Streptomyces sp. AC563]|uniref:hypothetical protein n=1 Tax=Streptomyces buecherae TaxID=2763006 RepID=UPI00164EA7BC
MEAALDERRGMVLFRGRDRIIGYVDPPLEVAARGNRLAVTALNERGRVLLPTLRTLLADLPGTVRADGD